MAVCCVRVFRRSIDFIKSESTATAHGRQAYGMQVRALINSTKCGINSAMTNA